MDPNTLAFFGAGGVYAAKKIADPSLTALGDRLRDLWQDRAEEARGVLKDATRMLDAAGLEPKEVPGRILWRILEHASADTSGEMRSHWAGLLANASADPSRVPVECPQILAQLSSLDATVLEDMADRVVREGKKYTAEQKLAEIARVAPSVEALRASLTNLERLMLIVPSETSSAFDIWDDDFIVAEKRARLTRYGVVFVVACRPPGSKDIAVTNAPHPRRRTLE